MNGPTERQLAFLTSLVAERQDKIAAMPPTWILRIKAAVNGELSGTETSKAIEYFRGIPVDQNHKREQPGPGFYLLDSEVYQVVLNKAGTNSYAKRCTRNGEVIRPEYAAGIIYQIALRPHRLSDEEARQYAPKPRSRKVSA